MSNVGSDHDHSRVRRIGIAPSLASVVAVALLVIVAGCMTKGSESKDAGADPGAAAGAVGDTGRAAAAQGRTTADTALSSGVGGLQGSIDSALAATARRIRPAARARPKVIPPL